MERVGKVPVTLLGAGAACVLGGLTAISIPGASGVHIPLLLAAGAGIALGLIDPKKGWIAGFIQSAVLLIGVLVIGRNGPIPEVENHSLIGAIGLTFVGSFIGAFIKRAFDS